MNKIKTSALVLATLFCVLAATYLFDANRSYTSKRLCEVPSTTATDNMLSSLNVTTIAQDNRSMVWIGTSAGINVYDGHSYTQFFHNTQDTAALPDDYINCLHRDRQGRMWIGTQNGLARYEGAGCFRRFRLPTNDLNISRIADSKTGNGVAVETSQHRPHQYFIVDDHNVRVASATELLPSVIDTIPGAPFCLRKPLQIVSCTFTDALGDTWVGFRNAGYQIVSKSQTSFKRANEDALALATRGKDIIALEKVGKYLLAGTTLRLYVSDTSSGALSETYYHSLFRQLKGAKPEINNIVDFSDDGKMWLVGNHEVLACSIDGNKPKVKYRWLSANGGEVQLGCGARLHNRLYVSCDDGAILDIGFDNNEARHIMVDNPWFDDETQLLALRDGQLLLFMRNMQIAIYSPQNRTIRTLKLKDTHIQGNVDPAFAREDSNGNVWLGTKRSGLFCLDMKKRSVERMKFLNDVHIQALAEDSKHNIWVTTLKDVVCYNPHTRESLLNSFVSSGQNERQCQFFDNAICLDTNGNVVLGSSDGCYFVSSDMHESSKDRHEALCVYALNVATTDGRKLVLNDSIADGSRYTFAHGENSLVFSFFYPNYGSSSSLMFQYRLEGYDHDWHAPTYGHTASYDNLSPGEYVFRLRLMSSPNLQPICERSVFVTIKTAWWTSWAAWLFYLTLVLSVIYYVNYLYLRLRTNRLHLVSEQHEREREQRNNEMNMSFFANISHEFRNPITLIAGPLMVLRSDESLAKDAKELLSRVCLSVNRMLRLIDQMLDFNQLETDALRLRVTHLDVAEELARLVASFEEPARVRGIKLDVEYEADDDFCMLLDADKFEKIMSNLFTNALKHTPDNGRIAIMMKRRHASDGHVWLDVEVFNSGSHISANRINDVFKRYYQLADVDASHKYGWGTGIGLYYVKRLVGLHHGHIEVSNLFDETHCEKDGVVFRFSLPMDDCVYKREEMSTEPVRVMQIPVDTSLDVEETTTDDNRPKILIVDDDVDVAQYMRSLFASDYNVENRYSAEAALSDMADIKPDIILSDIIMGEMSGYEFCRTLKANLLWSHIPVVLVTAKSNIDEQISGLRLGAVAYVTKPFDPTYVRALVESQLANMRTLRERLASSTQTEEVSDIADSMSDNDRHFMDELYAVMDKRLADFDLSVAAVSHDLLISQSKFNYKLKQLTGDTPGVFFRKYKLNRAARLLHEGSYSVSEVAVMTGFGTAAHFSVAFKKQFGTAPSEYA